jgi:hypothetical protein
LKARIVVALFIFPLLLAYGPVAVWARRSGGPRRLWLLCALALLSVVLLAVALSLAYSVPSAGRVVLYLLAFWGPSILFATGSLSVASAFTGVLPLQVAAALAGSLAGLVAGYITVVYVLGVW